jgi:hypothetical protein
MAALVVFVRSPWSTDLGMEQIKLH